MKNVRYDDWDQKKELLEKLELFQDFSRFDIPKIASLYHNVIYFEKNERIIREGSNDKCFYILLSGSVRVCKGDDPQPISHLFPGEFFGEISFLSNSRRTRHIFTNEKVFVLKVTESMMETLDSRLREKIKDKLIAKLIKRIMNPNAIGIDLDED